MAHGAFQGAMTEASGGKFWSGFAAGALSSIAASAWSGGASAPETHSFGGCSFTQEFVHKGLGEGLGNAGMVAFSTVVGGGAAALTGGNFWVGAATGLSVGLLNHYAHSSDDGEDSYDQRGRKVTKESLGIKKGDTKETMIDKTLKGMKIDDYITGDDASFLGEDAKTYIKTITRTGPTSFSIEGDSNFIGVRAFKTGATMDISYLKKPVLLEGGIKLSYKININGITTAGKAGNVYPVYYLGRNTS